jgi:N-acetylmuramoyl-L-alanine amidase
MEVAGQRKSESDCGLHNSQGRSTIWFISVHFNAYETTSKPMGMECLYVTQNRLAVKVAQAIANAGKFINRGSNTAATYSFWIGQ